MKTSYQRASGKTVGHSFGGCGTSNTPDSALLYIFSTFIHHTSQRYIIYYKISIIPYGNETEFPNEYYLNNYHLRESTLYHLKGDGRNDLKGNVFPIGNIYCEGSEFSNI
ncbi:hypothetical protein V1477_021163 [Vespula maculifrons]|uniref:Uncharacterized protein n=1 Tax=Vespula maculifrons TaxID=7453 RepID=A0ABD2AGW8_VESMC